MSGDMSNPTRFLRGQSATDDRNLALTIYGGEVLAAFDLATVTQGKHEIKNLGPGQGKAAQFPKTWKAQSEYHVPGVELLGTDIDTGEVTITVDDILVSHTAISDLDDMLSHFEVRSQFANAMGHELAKVYDKNVFRSIILASRATQDGPFPDGQQITDASLTNSGNVDGKAWYDAIIEANEMMWANDVPEYLPRYLAVNKRVFNAIKHAQDANGNYLALQKEFGTQAGGVSGRGEALEIDGVTIITSRNIPSADETSANKVYPKYRANYSTTTGVFWTPMAVGTVKFMDIGFETERDVRRLEDFLLAKMFVGHGTLRPECAIEFKTS